MTDEATGSLGGTNIRLAQSVPPDDRYRRNYIPISAQTSEIPGADAAVNPESNVATWAIKDWSAGEGDLRWTGVDRYDKSEMVAPTSDGSGLVVGPPSELTQYSAADFTKFRAYDAGVYINGGLYAADSVDDNVYKWNSSTEVWDLFRAIGGGATDVASLAVALASVVWVTDSTDLYKVTSSSSAVHYASSSFDSLGVFGSTLYGISTVSKLYTIDQTTPTTRTEVYDPEYSGNSIYNEPIAMSDVGPIYMTPDLRLHEYNQGDASGAVVGRLPADASYGRPFWARDHYFVPYKQSDGTGATTLASYIWFKSPSGEGVIGPLRETNNSFVQAPRILGLWGDRMVFVFTRDLWAYDMSSGAIVHLGPQDATDSVDLNDGILFDGAAFVHGTSGTDEKCARNKLFEYETTVGTLDTGRYDLGYLGLNKTLMKVTVSTESVLVSGDSVRVAYSADGAAFTYLSPAMTTGESTKSWAVSTSAGSTVQGIDFEFQVEITASSATVCPKVIQVVAEAIGAESRIEWIVPIDVSTNNMQNGNKILDALKTMRVAGNVVELSDPWQQLEYEAAETFDVTIEELSTPMEQGGGRRYAIARLRSSATVGA